jgi:periplasmic protein TonB
MSAAVNDRPHEVIVPLVHLPLTGELHPLRREFERWLAMGNMITITLGVVVCATIYFWPRPAPVAVDGRTIDIPGIINTSPPPIVEHGGGGPEILAVAPDVKANIEPTPDPNLETQTNVPPETGGGGESGIDEGFEGFAGSGPPIDIDPPAPAPDPNGIVVFDTMPVLVSINPPVYPEMVRDAGIDGTVLVRVFIALNGHVKDAYVVEGSSALREAALASARSAFFKPALQGTHPVEVWVVIPITFQLHERY